MPPELRNDVCFHALVPASGRVRKPQISEADVARVDINILCICKQVHSEALAIFYQHAGLRIDVVSHNPTCSDSPYASINDVLTSKDGGPLPLSPSYALFKHIKIDFETSTTFPDGFEAEIVTMFLKTFMSMIRKAQGEDKAGVRVVLHCGHNINNANGGDEIFTASQKLAGALRRWYKTSAALKMLGLQLSLTEGVKVEFKDVSYLCWEASDGSKAMFYYTLDPATGTVTLRTWNTAETKPPDGEDASSLGVETLARMVDGPENLWDLGTCFSVICFAASRIAIPASLTFVTALWRMGF